MKIVISINTAWNIFNFRLGLAKTLIAEGHEVIAVAPHDDYVEKLEELGISFHAIEMQNKGSNPVEDFKLYKQYKAIYKKINPDVILQYTIKPNIYGTFAAARLNIPVINNVSGLGTVFIRSNLTSLVAKTLYRFAFRKASKIFFQNEDDRILFVQKKLVKEKITDVLPGSGIDLQKFAKSPLPENNAFTFLMISRTLVDKGVREYAQAGKILKEKNINVQCQLIGSREIEPLGIPEKEFNDWINSGYIDYLGMTDNIKDYILKSQCVVLPSYREGTPRSLLEAAAMGRPIVTTDAPGCREVVYNNFNGFLCKVKSAKDLASKMEKTVHLSYENLKEFGHQSRLIVEEVFDEKIVINKYISAIEKAIQ